MLLTRPACLVLKAVHPVLCVAGRVRAGSAYEPGHVAVRKAPAVPAKACTVCADCAEFQRHPGSDRSCAPRLSGSAYGIPEESGLVFRTFQAELGHACLER